jgi:hypothetical protein
MSNQITFACSKSELDSVRYLFNNNKKAKDVYKYGMNSILEDVFKENIRYEGKFFIIENVENEGNSVLNLMNTNYTCFCLILNAMNKVLSWQDKEPICFDNKNELDQIDEMKLFISYIKFYKKRIFDKNSKIYPEILRVLGATFNKGEKTENKTLSIINKFFGESNVKSTCELVSKVDALSGIDFIIKHDGESKTAQIKPYKDLIYKDDFIEILESAQVKEYNVDWIVFGKEDKTLVFLNNNTKIENGNYVFPSNSLIFTLE